VCLEPLLVDHVPELGDAATGVCRFTTERCYIALGRTEGARSS